MVPEFGPRPLAAVTQVINVCSKPNAGKDRTSIVEVTIYTGGILLLITNTSAHAGILRGQMLTLVGFVSSR